MLFLGCRIVAEPAGEPSSVFRSALGGEDSRCAKRATLRILRTSSPSIQMTATRDLAPWIEPMARVGYTAKGILYLTIGYLAAKAGLGQGGSVTDTGGAMRQVKHASLGQPLLLVIAAGLLGYAAWRLVEAITDPERRGTDLKGILMRAGFAGRGLFHAALGLTAFRLALGRSGGASGSQAPHWTARAFQMPGGEILCRNRCALDRRIRPVSVLSGLVAEDAATSPAR